MQGRNTLFFSIFFIFFTSTSMWSATAPTAEPAQNAAQIMQKKSIELDDLLEKKGERQQVLKDGALNDAIEATIKSAMGIVDKKEREKRLADLQQALHQGRLPDRLARESFKMLTGHDGIPVKRIFPRFFSPSQFHYIKGTDGALRRVAKKTSLIHNNPSLVSLQPDKKELRKPFSSADDAKEGIRHTLKEQKTALDLLSREKLFIGIDGDKKNKKKEFKAVTPEELEKHLASHEDVSFFQKASEPSMNRMTQKERMRLSAQLYTKNDETGAFSPLSSLQLTKPTALYTKATSNNSPSLVKIVPLILTKDNRWVTPNKKSRKKGEPLPENAGTTYTGDETGALYVPHQVLEAIIHTLKHDKTTQAMLGPYIMMYEALMGNLYRFKIQNIKKQFRGRFGTPLTFESILNHMTGEWKKEFKRAITINKKAPLGYFAIENQTLKKKLLALYKNHRKGLQNLSTKTYITPMVIKLKESITDSEEKGKQQKLIDYLHLRIADETLYQKIDTQQKKSLEHEGIFYQKVSSDDFKTMIKDQSKDITLYEIENNIRLLDTIPDTKIAIDLLGTPPTAEQLTLLQTLCFEKIIFRYHDNTLYRLAQQGEAADLTERSRSFVRIPNHQALKKLPAGTEIWYQPTLIGGSNNARSITKKFFDIVLAPLKPNIAILNKGNATLRQTFVKEWQSNDTQTHAQAFIKKQTINDSHNKEMIQETQRLLEHGFESALNTETQSRYGQFIIEFIQTIFPETANALTAELNIPKTFSSKDLEPLLKDVLFSKEVGLPENLKSLIELGMKWLPIETLLQKAFDSEELHSLIDKKVEEAPSVHTLIDEALASQESFDPFQTTQFPFINPKAFTHLYVDDVVTDENPVYHPVARIDAEAHQYFVEDPQGTIKQTQKYRPLFGEGREYPKETDLFKLFPKEELQGTHFEQFVSTIQQEAEAIRSKTDLNIYDAFNELTEDKTFFVNGDQDTPQNKLLRHIFVFWTLPLLDETTTLYRRPKGSTGKISKCGAWRKARFTIDQTKYDYFTHDDEHGTVEFVASYKEVPFSAISSLPPTQTLYKRTRIVEPYQPLRHGLVTALRTPLLTKEVDGSFRVLTLKEKEDRLRTINLNNQATFPKDLYLPLNEKILDLTEEVPTLDEQNRTLSFSWRLDPREVGVLGLRVAGASKLHTMFIDEYLQATTDAILEHAETFAGILDYNGATTPDQFQTIRDTVKKYTRFITYNPLKNQGIRYVLLYFILYEALSWLETQTKRPGILKTLASMVTNDFFDGAEMAWNRLKKLKFKQMDPAIERMLLKDLREKIYPRLRKELMVPPLFFDLLPIIEILCGAPPISQAASGISSLLVSEEFYQPLSTGYPLVGIPAALTPGFTQKLALYSVPQMLVPYWRNKTLRPDFYNKTWFKVIRQFMCALFTMRELENIKQYGLANAIARQHGHLKALLTNYSARKKANQPVKDIEIAVRAFVEKAIENKDTSPLGKFAQLLRFPQMATFLNLGRPLLTARNKALIKVNMLLFVPIIFNMTGIPHFIKTTIIEPLQKKAQSTQKEEQSHE